MGILLAGAIPTGLAGTVTNVQGLLALRFFIGILGGSFIPCQVWTTGFFDKEIVGAANSFAAGLGNAGSGITYFAMPAIFDSLVRRQHLTEHVAWRVAFVVPLILITATALAMIFLCPDTPSGKWSAGRRAAERQLATRDTFLSSVKDRKGSGSGMCSSAVSDDLIRINSNRDRGHDREAQVQEQDVLEAASWELVEKPTIRGSSNAILSLPTLTLVAVYFCSFGAELCINSILASYYVANFPGLGQTSSGNWAAMFGLLNVIMRPIGGMISDAIYRSTRSLWGKKILIHFFGVATGAFLLTIGLIDSHSKSTMFGLVLGLAFFLEAGNGACFSLVPHVHPSSNGTPALSQDLTPALKMCDADWVGNRYHHGCNRRSRNPRWYCLFTHCPLCRCGLRQAFLDYRCYHDCCQSRRLSDSTDTQGTARWPVELDVEVIYVSGCYGQSLR